MILPVLLRKIGYMEIPVFRLLDDISHRLQDDALYSQKPWCELRDLFEYVACVEHARQNILGLPTRSSQLGSEHETSARYDSAASVLFAQAALDNLAVWLNNYYDLGLKNNNISFYKRKMPEFLAKVDRAYIELFDRHEGYVQDLNNYRMAWLHKVSGGARFVAEDPSNAEIKVPMAPINFSLTSDPLSYLNEIEKIKSENSGEWLMPASEFVDWVKNGMLYLINDVLTVVTETRERHGHQ
ncbi:hypothetical protein [Pseudomonas putida]|uniref:hypothetical protein n=1 Tax=Pseudomonas putida TaxID=303 RepID=UPI00384C8A20